MVSVDVKHHVYSLMALTGPNWTFTVILMATDRARPGPETTQQSVSFGLHATTAQPTGPGRAGEAVEGQSPV